MKIVFAALVTAAVLSMAIAAAGMIYDTTLPHPGIGKRAARTIMVLWLWPVATLGLGGLAFGLGWLWGWAT